MASIGTTLREERIRLGLGIDQVEADTKIRAKYLMALEDERFEALPGTAYARAFLRDYAEQLGLDPQELVNRLNAVVGARGRRRARAAHAPVAPGPILGRWQWVALGGAIALVVALLAFAAYSVVGGGSGGTAAGAAHRPDRRDRAREVVDVDRAAPPQVAKSTGRVPCRPGEHLARGARGLGERARCSTRTCSPPAATSGSSAASCGSRRAPRGTCPSRRTAIRSRVPSKVKGHLLVTRSDVRAVA